MKTKTSTATDPLRSQAREVGAGCLITRTRRISRVITSIFDQELRPHGVNSTQFSILNLITARGGQSRAQIARFQIQERSTSTRNLQLILDQGWAEEIVPEKGRSRPIVLSEAGRALYTAALPAWHAAQKKAKRLIGEDGAAALIALDAKMPTDQ